ncbi:Ethyl tert-butyl ether degradation [Mycena venus]|uniref:Ethyl tert-butyl ether degradation n=1 Tax=Mycena venus TaxID=2733690 RepID=A0A8H6Y168_9AGAR|nr:Ethyl tert-butyl ether degradation [Mycena venus]
MTTPVRSERVRIAIFVKRKSGMSKEEFSHYWAEVHGPQFMALDVAKRNVLKYEQAHLNDEMVRIFGAGGFPMPDYDGIAILEGESYPKLMKVSQSEKVQNFMREDSENFMDAAAMQYLPLDTISFTDEI